MGRCALQTSQSPSSICTEPDIDLQLADLGLSGTTFVGDDLEGVSMPVCHQVGDRHGSWQPDEVLRVQPTYMTEYWDSPVSDSIVDVRVPSPISAYTLYHRKLESLPTFLSLIVRVYLRSHFCSELQKTHLFCNRVLIGRSRSSKVDDFGTNRKPICDFLLVHVCNHGLPFLKYGDLLAKIAYFPYPSFIRCSRCLCSLWNFALKLTTRKPESWGYPVVKTAWS